MSAKLKVKSITTGMILLIIVCFVPTVAGAFEPGGGKHDKGFDKRDRHRPVLGIWRDSQMIQKLGLTSEQVKEIREADFTFREKHLALKTQIDGLRLQMDKAFSEDVVDDAALLSLAEKISNLKGKLFVQKIESRLTLGKILNADQIKKMKLYDMHQKRKGPKQSQKQIVGRHSVEKHWKKKHF